MKRHSGEISHRNNAAGTSVPPTRLTACLTAAVLVDVHSLPGPLCVQYSIEHSADMGAFPLQFVGVRIQSFGVWPHSHDLSRMVVGMNIIYFGDSTEMPYTVFYPMKSGRLIPKF